MISYTDCPNCGKKTQQGIDGRLWDYSNYAFWSCCWPHECKQEKCS